MLNLYALSWYWVMHLGCVVDRRRSSGDDIFSGLRRVTVGSRESGWPTRPGGSVGWGKDITMLPTQIYGTVAFLGNHNQTQVHDQHYPATSWNCHSHFSRSHPTAWLAAYDNRRLLLNPCSAAASQGWEEFKRTLGRRGIRRPRSHFLTCPPTNDNLLTRLNFKTNATYILFESPRDPGISSMLCAAHDDASLRHGLLNVTEMHSRTQRCPS